VVIPQKSRVDQLTLSNPEYIPPLAPLSPSSRTTMTVVDDVFTAIEPYARELGACILLLSFLGFYLINRGELFPIITKVKPRRG
jgi:hypothetical protein